jgi:flagellar motor switch protein FliN
MSVNAAELLTLCQQNAAEAGGSVGRAFGGNYTLTAESSSDSLGQENYPASWQEAGLLALLKCQSANFLAVLPNASPLLPADWNPTDKSCISKLQTLAQEWGFLFLPPEFNFLDAQAEFVTNLQECITRSELLQPATSVSMTLANGEKTYSLLLVGPISQADKTFQAAVPSPTATPAAPVSAKNTTPTPEISTDAELEALEEALAKMPPYVRNLLQIRIPLNVTLAKTTQPVSLLLEMGPGAVIQFSRNCEQPLMLCAGNEVLAEGQAIKIGDKFGIRVSAMSLPKAHFFPILNQRAG